MKLNPLYYISHYSSMTLSIGAQASFNVTIKPKLFGMYESTRARIKYGSGGMIMEDVEPDYRQGYSTSLGRTKIISALEDARNNEYFVKQWMIFAVLYAIPTLLPFFLWHQSKVIIKKSKEMKKNQ